MMVGETVIRPLEIVDMPVLSILLQSAFDVSVAPYLTYSQHGIAALLSLQTRHPASFEVKKFYVATVHGRLAGFAEFRLPEADHGFLCYICVAPTYRRRGISRGMINQFESDHPAVRHLDLDVFEHNDGARRAYEGFGFEPIGLKYWLRRRLPDATNEVLVTDLMSSAAAFERYGFCKMIVNSSGGPVTIGRIGGTVLRCYDVQTYLDDHLLGGLCATFTGLREALVIVDETSAASVHRADQTGAGSSTDAPIRSYRLRRTINNRTRLL